MRTETMSARRCRAARESQIPPRIIEALEVSDLHPGLPILFRIQCPFTGGLRHVKLTYQGSLAAGQELAPELFQIDRYWEWRRNGGSESGPARSFDPVSLKDYLIACLIKARCLDQNGRWFPKPSLWASAMSKKAAAADAPQEGQAEGSVPAQIPDRKELLKKAAAAAKARLHPGLAEGAGTPAAD